MTNDQIKIAAILDVDPTSLAATTLSVADARRIVALGLNAKTDTALARALSDEDAAIIVEMGLDVHEFAAAKAKGAARRRGILA